KDLRKQLVTNPKAETYIREGEIDFQTVHGSAFESAEGIRDPHVAFENKGTPWMAKCKPSNYSRFLGAIGFHFEKPLVLTRFSFTRRINKFFKDDGPSKYEFFGSNDHNCMNQ
ncbi:unnamed protein product, partial [Meganyctiphanes norvegica]